jgi:hypothetical protein
LVDLNSPGELTGKEVEWLAEKSIVSTDVSLHILPLDAEGSEAGVMVTLILTFPIKGEGTKLRAKREREMS